MRYSILIPGAAAALAAVVHDAPAQQQASRTPYPGFNPGACVYAQRWIDHMATWNQPDRTVYIPAKDTTSRLASDSVRVCGASFGGTTTDEPQQLNLARMQLIMGADSDARATAQWYLKTVGSTPAERRGWALYLIVNDALAAHPARFAIAREALAELDKLPGSRAPRGNTPGGAGDGVTKARVFAHFEHAEAALRHFDDSTAAAEAKKVIAEWKLLPPRIGASMAGEQIARAFLISAEIAQRLSGPAPAQAIMDSADKVVPGAAGIWRSVVESYANLYPILGTRAAAVETQFWFPTSAAGVARPAAGRVTLISSGSHFCGLCAEQFRGVRRFGERFGGRVDIVNVTKTLGFYSDTAPVLADAEARFDSAYFLVRKGLPGVLGVYETKFSRIPDRRRVDHPTAHDRNYPGAAIVVVDKRGIIRYVSSTWSPWDPVLEEPLARFVERLLDEP